MNGTIKEAMVKRLHYESHQRLRAYPADFVTAYNFARRLETRRDLPLSNDLQLLDFSPRTIQTQSAPAKAGTKQLASLVRSAALRKTSVLLVGGFLDLGAVVDGIWMKHFLEPVVFKNNDDKYRKEKG